jgi:hypothetical protein
MVEEILGRLSQDWPIFSLLAVLLIKAFQSQLSFLVPEAVKNYFQMSRDRQEHVQETEKSILEFERLKELSQLSSLSFTEEQLTQLTAETQTQLNEANSFIRQLVSQKLDIVIELLTKLRGVQYEIKDIQSFILEEIKRIEES